MSRSEPQALKLNSYARRSLREEIERRDGSQCRLCGCGGPFDLDHVEPLWKAPHRALDRANLQVLCRPCHRRKTAAERSSLLTYRKSQR